MAITRVDPPLAASESETVRAYLDYHRDTLLQKIDGLDREQLGRTHPPSTLTLAGILKHAALNEDWWFVRVLDGREGEPGWVPPGAFDTDVDWELTSAPQDDPDELRRLYASARADADAAIDRALAKDGMDTLSHGLSRRREGERFSLRWILLHMVEETARHNGHADLLREAVDGTTGE